MKTEAAIIGAGPAGLIAAEVISSKGYATTVFEEHRKVGVPNHCAGIISVEGFGRLGIPLDDRFYLNTIVGGRLFSADGTCLEIRDKKPRAHIIDRGGFDGYLADAAVDSGVDLRTSTRVKDIVFTKKGVVGIKMGDYAVRSDILINAEGPGGRLMARAGYSTGQEGILNGFNVDLSGVDVESNMVEVWFSDEASKGFFTWVAPLGDDKVRVGLASQTGDGHVALKKFIKKRFNVTDVPKTNAGQVCTGGPVMKTAYHGMLLVGDVAGQVKPTTAGGVVIGGLCSLLTGESASSFLEGGKQTSLDWYEREWRRLYGHELSTMLTLRRLLNGIGDERMSRMFRAFNEEDMGLRIAALIEDGDMDMQADIIRRAFMDPVLLGIMAKVVGRVLLGEVMSFF
ncbi:NAD(P)/FAD-dependent oxidoreductase [Candidatus Bathyarchaeota archaeon]|nr:NAD(P)/FAD-dependent oxidoreductase [Candidatus Bathyarchaeota archaeon]